MQPGTLKSFQNHASKGYAHRNGPAVLRRRQKQMHNSLAIGDPVHTRLHCSLRVKNSPTSPE